MKSRVLYKGHNSNWFDVLQGTRQDGVLSPFLFLCFSNDLLNELCNSTAGLTNCNNIFGYPTVCDDMLLASLSKKGLQELIQICFLYSCKWHFEYMPIKCCVVVYNESKFEFLRTDRVWHIGNIHITKTSPCNEHPLTPHFYIVNLGFTGVYIFLIFAPKHRLWVLVRTASLRRL